MPFQNSSSQLRTPGGRNAAVGARAACTPHKQPAAVPHSGCHTQRGRPAPPGRGVSAALTAPRPRPPPPLHTRLARKLFDGSRGSRQSPARTGSSKPRNASSPDAAVQGLSGVKAWSGAGPSRLPFCCPARRLWPCTSPLRAEVTPVVPGSRAAGLRSGGSGLRRSLQAHKEPRTHLVRFRGVTALSPGPPTAVARGARSGCAHSPSCESLMPANVGHAGRHSRSLDENPDALVQRKMVTECPQNNTFLLPSMLLIITDVFSS